ncbi:hypothetical protein JXQ31_09785 [candidate division KSB1 bacterium]|nr:hypothetical protein [candidate division KSB1 bacterium]
MKTYKILFCLFLGWLLFTTACYTSFTHPVNTSDGQRIDTSDIYIIDNCSDCHQVTQFSCGTILPEAAQNDYSWQFWAKSAWWQDNFDFYPVDVVKNPESTLPRYQSDDTYDPIPIPAPLPVPAPGSLGKTNTDSEPKDTQKKDNRRSFDRRKQAQENDDDSSGNTRDSNRE